MINHCVLTTMDNIYNPFKAFDKWLNFDIEHKYNSCSWLAVFCKASSHMEEYDYNVAVSQAIDQVLEINPSGIHFKLYEEDADEVIKIANKAYRESMANRSSMPN